MDFKFSNISIFSEKEQKAIDQFVREKISHFEKYFTNYPKPLLIEIHFSEVKNKGVTVSCFINMKEDVVYAKETGHEVLKLLNDVLRKLKNAALRQKRKEQKQYLYKRKNRQIASVKNYADQLEEISNEEDRQTFNRLLQQLIPNLKKYIERRLRMAEMTNAIHKGELNAEDIIDELYLEIYQHFQQKPANLELHTWMYQKCNELLENKIQEEAYEQAHSTEIEEAIEKTFDPMSETYWLDAEGKKEPYDELEGPNINPALRIYQGEEILAGLQDEEQIDQIYASLNKNEIIQTIRKNMAKMPQQKRDVLDLYLIEQMNEDEIALIKKISVNTVQKYVNEGLNQIRNKLLQMI